MKEIMFVKCRQSALTRLACDAREKTGARHYKCTTAIWIFCTSWRINKCLSA